MAKVGATSKTISWLMLISATFFLSFMWFRKGIFNVWDYVGFDPSDIVLHARPDVGEIFDAEDRDQFALIAAASHTVVLLLGMGAFSLFKFVIQKGLGIKTGSPTTMTQYLFFGFVLLSFAIFTQWLFRNAFQRKHDFAHRWARGFFYDEGHLPFSIAASISYSVCLVCGYFLKFSSDKSQYSAFPRWYRRWVWKIIAIFITSLFFFRLIVVPLWKTLGKTILPADANDVEVSFKFVTVATVSHTIALLGGMFTSSLSWMTWKLNWSESSNPQNYSQEIASTPSKSPSSASLRSSSKPKPKPKLKRKLAKNKKQLNHDTTPAVPERKWSYVLTALIIWVVAMLGIFILYFLTKSSVIVLKQHIDSYPTTAIVISMVLWFLWGYLLIADKLPSAIYALIFIAMLPLKLTRGKKGSRIRKIWQFLCVYCIYNLQIFVASTLVITFALARFYPEHVMLFWIIVASRYAKTYRNHPAITGCRMNKEMLSHWMFDEIGDYFSLSVHSQASPSAFKKDARYFFCHHPHGILPLSCGFIPRTTQWKEACNNVCPAPLSSSVLHHVPLMRDGLQLMGGGDVSKGGIAATLKRHDSIVLIPGGQQELLTSSSKSKKLSVCSKHKGFIRLAYQLSSASDKDFFIVPIYNFGEESILDNAQAPMSWQKYSVQKLRANVFFLPLGYYNLPGVVRKEKMTTAIAKPIKVPRIEKPNEQEVALLHRRYFSALREVFEETKEKAGHKNKDLVFDLPFKLLSEKEWLSQSGLFTTQRAKHEDVDEMFYGAGDLLERIATGIFWIVVFVCIFGHAYVSLENGIWGTLFH
eukprot:m.28354 g.28354  ORF g.28354 m.28354 type:complete len:812 (-) comp6040_c0_seq1:360-2795(-)